MGGRGHNLRADRLLAALGLRPGDVSAPQAERAPRLRWMPPCFSGCLADPLDPFFLLIGEGSVTRTDLSEIWPAAPAES